MAGRALVFSDAEVIRLLTTRFVTYAGDQWYLHRQQDADGQFFRNVAEQGHYGGRPPDSTRQGIYAATPDGALLASSGVGSAGGALETLNRALTSWQQRAKGAPAPAAGAARDARFQRVPPAGGLILNTFSRIPLTFEGAGWNRNQATGRDHVWLTEAEWRSLLPPTWQRGVRYPMPPKLVDRLARLHLVDNVRGEPDGWRREEVREAAIFLTVESVGSLAGMIPARLRLQGGVRLSAPADPASGNTPLAGNRRPERGYDARLDGYLDVDPQNGRITRCDLLAWGEAWGHGWFNPNPPAGRFPLLIAFSLAGNRPGDRVPPEGMRHPENYF